MVKLEAKDVFFNSVKAFYFHNMADCRTFLYVFRNHWCNVPWNTPVEAPSWPEMNAHQRRAMDLDPKERAESCLSWGFHFAKRNHIGNTEEQNVFIRSFIRDNHL